MYKRQTLDLIGIFFFATSGALLAARKQFDLVGSLALSLLAGLGGGFTRDILLDRGLPASLENPVYLAPPVLVSLLVYVKVIHPNRLNLTITLFDAAAQRRDHREHHRGHRVHAHRVRQQHTGHREQGEPCLLYTSPSPRD